MDPTLRSQALRVAEVYRVKQANVQGSYADLVPAMMKTVSDLVAAYDRGELNVTTQKKLIGMMKKLVSRYPL